MSLGLILKKIVKGLICCLRYSSNFPVWVKVTGSVVKSYQYFI